MGFIFAGQGFKRQNIELPGGRNGKRLRQCKKNGSKKDIKKNERIKGSTTNIGGKTNQLTDFSVCLESPISEDSSHVQVSPGLGVPGLGVPGLGVPGLGAPHLRAPTIIKHIINLVDLPVELLYRIFTYAGVGTSNQLSLTCKYLHKALDFSNNDYLLAMIVRHNFMFELTRKSEAEYWVGKFSKKAKQVPSEFYHREIHDSLFTCPIIAAKTLEAVDCRVFSISSLRERHARFIVQHFGSLIVDEETAEDDSRRKLKFLEWKYMQCKKFVSLAVDAVGGTHETTAVQLHHEAITFEPCVQFKNTHSLERYHPFTERSEFPQYVYKHMTPQRLEMFMYLHESTSMKITLPGTVISSFFARNGVVSEIPEISETSHDILMKISSFDTTTEADVTLALVNFHECRSRLLAVPLEERETHPYERPLNMYLECLKQILNTYNELHPEDTSMMIWYFIRQIEMPELVRHMIHLGVEIPLGIF